MFPEKCCYPRVSNCRPIGGTGPGPGSFPPGPEQPLQRNTSAASLKSSVAQTLRKNSTLEVGFLSVTILGLCAQTPSGNTHSRHRSSGLLRVVYGVRGHLAYDLGLVVLPGSLSPTPLQHPERSSCTQNGDRLRSPGLPRPH